MAYPTTLISVVLAVLSLPSDLGPVPDFLTNLAETTCIARTAPRVPFKVDEQRTLSDHRSRGDPPKSTLSDLRRPRRFLALQINLGPTERNYGRRTASSRSAKKTKSINGCELMPASHTASRSDLFSVASLASC